jgi:hypothetical protein
MGLTPASGSDVIPGNPGTRGESFEYTRTTSIPDSVPLFFISGVSASDPTITYITGLWAATSGGFYNLNLSTYHNRNGTSDYTVYYTYQ